MRWRQGVVSIGSFGPIGTFTGSGTIAVGAVGIPVFWWLATLPRPVAGAATMVIALVAVAVHDAGGRILKEKDSHVLVWDEITGYLAAVVWLPFSWQLALVAFVLERAFDIVKIPPAPWIERRVPGGWGDVGDDLIAALYTRLVLELLHRGPMPGLLGG